ncbi:MAG: hypothetical protein J6Q37_03655 [Bacteroidales bacterium]|nr:hypothetical protein [Bacteroidales bacterium]
MKRFLSILSLVILGFVSTACYDDTDIREKIDDLDGRVTTLETLCTELNSNLSALTTLVQAMQKGDYVVSVSPLIEDGVEVGYRIVFKESGVVDLYHGKDGADGEDGKDGANGADGKDGANGQDGANGTDGHTPVLGTKQDTDGAYYWTIDGEWVLDGEGNKIPLVTVGATPQLKIEDETWFVSYDDGKTWEELGAAVAVGIKDIKEENGELVIIMADGTVIAVPLGSPMKVVLGEFDAAALQYGADLEIPYTIEGAEGDVVVFLLKEGAAFEAELVEEEALAGKVVVKQLAAAQTEAKGKIGIFASAEDGTTVSQAVRLTSGVFYSVEGNKEAYEVEAAGGNVEFTVATNTAFEVKADAEWITYVETKAVEEKTLTFAVAANEGEAREAAVEVASGDIVLSFTVAQAGGYVPAPEESLVGAYKIQKFWVYGGTGPAYGGAGWVDLHNKTWWFDETTGHGIKAELDNYLEFTLTEFNADGTQSTGKCVNWAGADGKNWDTWFYNNKKSDGTERNPEAPKDGSNFYRQIPIGESTWVRDYTVTPNTVTFTDAEGRKTVLELLEPGYEFTTDKYGDSNAAANKRTFPRTEGDDLTFHAKLTGWKEVWPARYSELDKVFDCPREFFIDVDKVDEVPAESKTSEDKWVPELPEPEEPETPETPATLAGTYKYSTDFTVGGKDGSITVKGLTDQYATWEPAASKVKLMKNDLYTFTPTGTDANGNETGTVTFDDGGDGTWDFSVYDNTNNNKMYDATELYCFIAQDNTSTYVYDATAGTITFTTRGEELVVDYLVPGTYTYSTKDVTVPTSSTFGMHYDMGYTEARIPGYSTTSNGCARHYVWARDWVLCLVKQ